MSNRSAAHVQKSTESFGYLSLAAMVVCIGAAVELAEMRLLGRTTCIILIALGLSFLQLGMAFGTGEYDGAPTPRWHNLGRHIAALALLVAAIGWWFLYGLNDGPPM